MKKPLLALALVFALSGCFPMGEESATRAVEAMGLTDVKIEGMAVFGCSNDDNFRSRFSATNPKGQRVTGVVCGGFFKGSTVRFD